MSAPATHGHVHGGRRGVDQVGAPSTSPARATGKVDANAFYHEYHGHRICDLAAVTTSLRAQGKRGVVWLAGDSTLDNKFWLRETCLPANGYEKILEPPLSVPDVAHWVNHELMARAAAEVGGSGSAPGAGETACVNAAREESTLGFRREGRSLVPQDVFIRDNIAPEDTLVVSVGGNDIALAPSLATIFSIVPLVTCCPAAAIRSGKAWGLGHFERLFRDKTRAYVEAVVAKTKPRRVLVCTLYYLDERAGGSWADVTLKLLGYNSDPGHLQLLIRTVFERATSQIEIPGVEVVPIPLFEAMDGKDTRDYVQRVEPSSEGGRKMARLIVEGALGSKYCKRT